MALIVAILLGFALRAYDLDGQSMWSDEGLSLYRASLTVPEIMANSIIVDGVETTDTNPPFYFLLLHLIRKAAGDTVSAMRFLGVAAGTLSIPLIYVLGSTTLGRRIGLVAAILMAISPFHIWQSQILRNYGLLVTLNLLSVYGLFRYALADAGDRRARWLILWLVAGLLGIYTHFYAFFVFAFGLLALGTLAVRSWGIGRLLKSAWFWVALVLALVILLPATALAIDRFAAGGQIDFFYVPLNRFLIQLTSAFSVGVDRSLYHTWWRVVPVLLIAVLGLWFAWRRNSSSTAVLLGYQIIPLGLVYALSFINPIYNGVRHLLIGLPPFLIFLASGIVGPRQLTFRGERGATLNRAWRLIGPVLAVVVIVNQLTWLNSQFTSPDLVRDDVRGPALYLSEHAGPDDVIILHDTLIRPTFAYYYDGQAPVVSIPQLDDVDVELAIQTLQAEAADADRVWFLTEPTPRTGFDREVLDAWATDNWRQFLEMPYAAMWLRVRLEGYQPQVVVPTVPDDKTAVDLVWDQALRMHGYDVQEETTAGEDWLMAFYLSQPTDIPEQHTVLLRAVDEKGQEWAVIDDTVETGFPPAASVADTIMRYDLRTALPPGVPPGRYSIHARLVRTADGQSVPLTSGEVEYHLADVTVRGASCSADDTLSSDVQLSADFGGAIELLGYDTPAVEVRPGHSLSFNVWWCAKRQPEADYRLRFRLIDDNGQVVGESIGPLVREDHPSSHWQEDELLIGKPQVTVPGGVEAGLYDLELSVIQPDSDDPLRIGWPLGKQGLSLGSVEVVPWPMESDLPAISSPLQADFGQPPIIEFHGYELTGDELPAGDSLGLTLVWRSLAGDLRSSYKVFVHLVDDEGEIVAQSDNEPVGGFRPTTSWRAGEVLSDDHSLNIPAEIGPGKYTLWAGLYDPETSQRLPIYVDGQEQPDGRLKLATLTRQP
ncbi:MAG: glycosyltransferase family 39 protein [Chloroflexota bacterium]|nr:MAG: glycosyltransferase family 39 protein [Chloroflexota bacterium]